MEKREHKLSAILEPKFKLDWVQDEKKRMQYRLMLKREFQKLNCDDSAARDSDQAQSSGGSDKKDPVVSFLRFNKNTQVHQKD